MADGSATQLAQRCAVVWAKSWPRDGREVESWLPLWRHLDDTGDVAGLLWDQWLSVGSRTLLADALDGDADVARRLLVWLAGVHDIGKATPAFAVQVPRLSDRMVTAGLKHTGTTLMDRSRLRHEVAGAAILDRWLQSRSSLGRFDRGQLTDVVAGHHGTYPMERVVREAPSLPHLIGVGPWEEVQDWLLDRAAARAGLDFGDPRWSKLCVPQAAQTLLTGVVVMADWIASGEDVELFDIDDVPSVPAPLPGPDARVLRAWAEVNLGRRWVPRPSDDDAERFTDRFPAIGGNPRPVQVLVAEQARTMAAPGLMIIEAGVGVGKTEAALMAVETLAARCGSSGCLLALPTQTTSNAMFSRMLRWLERLPDGDGIGTQSVALAHGKVALNDELRDVRLGRWRSGAIFEDDDPRLTPVVVPWTQGRRRSVLSAFVVATIDQVLFAALRARHTTLRHLALAGKVLVIDEVHAADVYMSAFLERALEWLAAAGTPIILMSATLPAERRIALYVAYERGRRARLGLEPDDGRVRAVSAERLGGDIGYPSVVVTSDDGPRVTTLPPSDHGRSVLLHRLDDDLDSLAALLDERLAEGGCAVVIRNTVRRAQEAGRFLTDRFGVDAVTVCHAGFLAADRAAKDARLLREFGPPGPATERPAKSIVVATQVVEQSLDVDFDLMVSDVAPVDLILQRLGRLHRHERGAARPARLRDATCFVTGVDWTAPVPRFDPGARAVYGSWLLFCGLAVLWEHLSGGPVLLPDDIARLVQAAYAEDVDMPAEWRERAETARSRFASAEAERRRRAEDFGLSPVREHGTPLYGSDRFSVGTVDEDDPKGQACVRDSGDSIEAAVLQHSGGVDRIPDWVAYDGDRALPLRDHEVPGSLARVLARCTLRLPYTLTRPGQIDVVLDDLLHEEFLGWDRTPLLKYQIPLVLDDDRRAVIAGHVLEYDERYGLVVEATSESGGD